MKVRVICIIFCVAAASLSCLEYSRDNPNDPGGTQFHEPVIESFTAAKATIDKSEEVILTVNASDKDKDSLTYSYEILSGKGSLSESSASSVSYTASDTEGGENTVQVTVNDGHGGMATATVTIEVNKSWQVVGDRGIKDTTVAKFGVQLIVDKNDSPFVMPVGEDAIVKTYDGSNWIYVGNKNFSYARAYHATLAVDHNNVLYSAFEDEGQSWKAVVKKFNGTSWNDIGTPGFSSGAATNISLAFDSSNVPYVAFADGDNSYKLSVMKYDTTWQLVGSAFFSSGGTSTTNLFFDDQNNLSILYRDFGLLKGVYEIFNTTWQVVSDSTPGNPVDLSARYYNGIPYIIYPDADNSFMPSVMKYENGIWSYIGYQGIYPYNTRWGNIDFDKNGIMYASFTDIDNNNTVTVMQYNDNNWTIM